MSSVMSGGFGTGSSSSTYDGAGPVITCCVGRNVSEEEVSGRDMRLRVLVMGRWASVCSAPIVLSGAVCCGISGEISGGCRRLRVFEVGRRVSTYRELVTSYCRPVGSTQVAVEDVENAIVWLCELCSGK